MVASEKISPAPRTVQRDNELEHKHEVPVQSYGEAQKLSDEIKEELRSSGMMDEHGKLKLKGVSAKMLKRMKAEFVNCPVLSEETHFIKCFVCPNFQSRVTGLVLCRGNDLGKAAEPKEPQMQDAASV